MTRTIGIYVFDDVEVLDFAGPYEVFTCATRVGGKLTPGGAAPFRVRTIGQRPGMLRARAGLSVLPEADFGTCGKIDVLIVAGGVVAAELAKPEVLDWIAATARDCELVASVCTGAFLLAAAGLLDGQPATTHWEDIEDLRAAYPQIVVRSPSEGLPRWIDNGGVVTSGGISAGIDMSLHLVERFAGHELAELTARQMEYEWNNRR